MTSVMELATARHGGPLPADIPARYYAEAEARFARELEPIPGVIAALDRIVLPTCVASSGPHHKMEVTLRRTGLWERFAGRIFSATEVRTASRRRTCSCTRRADGLRAGHDGGRRGQRAGRHAARAAGMRALAFAHDTDAAAGRRRRRGVRRHGRAAGAARRLIGP